MADIKNIVSRGKLVIHSVDIQGVGGCGNSALALSSPVELGGRSVSPFTLCRMCLVRLPVSPLEKVVLEFVLTLEETMQPRRFSYVDLGIIIDRCEHSTEKAVASLRKHGLVLTVRAGREGSTLTFTCGTFVSWATALLHEAGLLSDGYVCHVPETDVSVISLQDSVPNSGFSVSKTAESVSKPGVRRLQPRRRKTKELAAKKESQVQPAPFVTPPAPAHTSETPAPAEIAAAPDDDYIPKAPDIDPTHIIGMSAPYEGEFDSTVERADTLKVSGRELSSQPDDDEFSLGSDTAETDMGYGVRMNPNI
jgi:hypothetical protein